jgi:hypothetical protein
MARRPGTTALGAERTLARTVPDVLAPPDPALRQRAHARLVWVQSIYARALVERIHRATAQVRWGAMLKQVYTALELPRPMRPRVPGYIDTVE